MRKKRHRMNCLLHILDSTTITARISTDTRCHLCRRRIAGSDTKWITWDILSDSDPDTMFSDIQSKYCAFLRMKRRPSIKLDFSAEQRSFVKTINSRLTYWMRCPLDATPDTNDEIYQHFGYTNISVGTFLDSIVDSDSNE